MGDDDDVACLIGSHNFRGKTIDITRGDYSDLMKRLVDNLKLAKVITMTIVKNDLLSSLIVIVCAYACVCMCVHVSVCLYVCLSVWVVAPYLWSLIL